MTLGQRFLDLIFPRRCVKCGAFIDYPGALCDACLIALPLERTFFCGECGARIPTQARVCHKKFPALFGAATSYNEDCVQHLIHLLKFKGVRDAALSLGEILSHYAYALRSDFSHYTLIPIPLGLHRRRTRGYNQAELIGRVVADHLQIPLATHILFRSKNTQAQTELHGGDEREKNVAGCFFISEGTSIHGKSFLLIDDVVTSGATLTEAARALRTAGARHVVAFAAARA